MFVRKALEQKLLLETFVGLYIIETVSVALCNSFFQFAQSRKCFRVKFTTARQLIRRIKRSHLHREMVR